MGICYLFLNGLLQTQSNGSIKLMDFIDEQRMCRLYEKFILEYYRKEFPQVTANASQISWQLDDDVNDKRRVCYISPFISLNNSSLSLYSFSPKKLS